MVEKATPTSLRARRGGRYLELKRSSSCKKKPALPSPATPTAAPYKGVRMRTWGKWVTEIRDPATKTRIWLGSFATAEMAARAYDAAVVCLKGPCAPEVNFPDSIPSFVISQCHSSPKEIQAVALAAAMAALPAATPLTMAAPEQTDPLIDTDVDQSFEITEIPSFAEDPYFSNMENWINNVLDDQDAPPMDHLLQFLDFADQPLFQWPVLEDYDDSANCSMTTHCDAQLWSFT